MSSLQERLKSLGLTIAPAFNAGLIRAGAEWFVGREFVVQGRTVQLAWFGDFRDKKKRGEWRSELVEELDPEARGEAEKQIAEALAAERAERQKFWNVVAVEALEMWESGTDRGEHPYIVKEKKLSGLHGTRIMMNEAGYPVLLIPMRDVEGKLWNLTRIYTKDFVDDKGNKRGKKFTLKGGRKEGTFYLLGELYPKGTIYMCEGFATAASVREALSNQTVAACFDAGNLLPVAKALREKYPEIKFVFCADNDVWKPEHGNAGLESARAAIAEVGGELRLPIFKDTKTKPTDFNDLACLEGLPVVAEQCLNPPKELPEPAPDKQTQKALGEASLVRELLDAYGGNILKQDRDVFEYSEDMKRWTWYPPREAADRYMKIMAVMTRGKMKFRDLQAAYARFLMELPYVPRGRNMFSPPPYVTNFQNGALELLPQQDGTFKLEFREKRKSDLLCYSHPFDYSLDAPYNTEFEDTVRKVLDEQDVDAYYEVLGACLIPAFPKVALFTGKPGGGKSTLVLLASHLVDRDLRCHVDPSDFRGFGMETMAGKLVNMHTDIALARPIAENILKLIEDRADVRISRKGITDIYAPLPAMHLFAANGLPKTVESIEPFTRRVLIFKADKYSSPETGFIRDFAHHVWSKNPQGVVRRALEGAGRLAANRGHFSISERGKEAMSQWKEKTRDYVEQFVYEMREGTVELSDSETKASISEKGRMTREQLKKVFYSWFELAAPRRVPPDAAALYARLEELGLKKTKSGNNRFFEGFGVKEAPKSQF